MGLQLWKISAPRYEEKGGTLVELELKDLQRPRQTFQKFCRLNANRRHAACMQRVLEYQITCTSPTPLPERCFFTLALSLRFTLSELVTIARSLEPVAKSN